MPSKPHEPISLIQMVLIMLGFKQSMIISFIKAIIAWAHADLAILLIQSSPVEEALLIADLAIGLIQAN